MTDRLELINQVQQVADEQLKTELEKVTWPIDYGNVKIVLRAGKPAVVVVERTLNLDKMR